MVRSTPFRHALAALVVAVPMLASSLAHAEVDKKTERVFKANCASCHGADGKGQTEKGKKLAVPDMSSAAWKTKTSDADMRKQIENGVNMTKNGIKKEMDAFKDKLKPEQIDALIAMIKTF